MVCGKVGGWAGECRGVGGREKGGDSGWIF